MGSAAKPPRKADTAADNMLFRVKLHIPVIQKKLISRKRIDNALDGGLKGRLTLVTAPAGFGKTTAVIKWINQVNIPAAWFSIDSYDNSLKRFWSYLIAALNTILPGMEEKFSQYLYSTNSGAIEEVVAVLVNELMKFRKDFILVMDDYHLIEDDSVHESLALLIKYLPENAHIVIISRSQPPFSSIRLQTVGQVKEVRISDLQFTSNEIAEYCRERGMFLSNKDIKALESLTEGWAAGLFLILDSDGHNYNFKRQFPSSGWENLRISSYLTEEVMSRWTEDERSFMLKTSMLSSMTGPLCDVLTGRMDGAFMLKSLSDNNTFVIPLDNEGQWYRYHHLFFEFLQKQLNTAGISSVSPLHERAGGWYEKNGYFSEAAGHYLQGGKYEKAAAVIEKLGLNMIKTGEFSTLLGWLGSLPADIVKGSDMLCLTYAWTLVLSDRADDAEYWINLVETRDKEAVLNNVNEGWKSQIEIEIVSIRGLMGLMNEDSQRILKSVEIFKDKMLGESIFCSWGLNFNRGEASLLAGTIGSRGQLSRLDKEYTEIYERARKYAIRNYYGYIPVLMGEIYFERNSIEKSIPLLMKGIDEAENSGMAGSYVPCVITLARIMKSRGDMKGAFETVRAAEQKLMEMGNVHLLPVIAAFRARLNIESGNTSIVEDWLRVNCLDIHDMPNMQKMYEYITLARVLNDMEDYDNCLLLLTKLLILAEKEKNLIYIIEILNLQSIVYQALGQTQRAMEVIEKSLRLGEKEGYERIFIEEGIPMAAILGRFVRSYNKEGTCGSVLVSPVYVRKLLKYTRAYCIIVKTFMVEKAKSKRASQLLGQPLTKREKDVLRLLDSELTNAEIAYTLDITLNTVKVNCTNIYRKLDVKNREQAVRCARELNILN